MLSINKTRKLEKTKSEVPTRHVPRDPTTFVNVQGEIVLPASLQAGGIYFKLANSTIYFMFALSLRKPVRYRLAALTRLTICAQLPVISHECRHADTRIFAGCVRAVAYTLQTARAMHGGTEGCKVVVYRCTRASGNPKAAAPSPLGIIAD